MPDRRKRGLDITRYQAIGLELARMRDRLTHLSAEIGNAYPKASKPARLADRIVHPIDALRTELANRYFAENPDATTDPYWPSQSERTGTHEPHIVGHLPLHDTDLWCCPAHAEEYGAR